jgi:hypothetical protein
MFFENCLRVMRVVAFAASFAICESGSSQAATNGIDTPSGVTILPIAVEGMESMDLVAQSATGPVYVGIGITNPSYNLVVSNAVHEGLEFGPGYASGKNLFQSYNRNTSAYVELDSVASLFTWQISGAEKMRIDSSGNVGIGTTSPGQPLTVMGPNNNWGVNVNYGNANGPQYGLLAQGSIWAGYFVGPIYVGQNLTFPDGTQQTTAASGHNWGGEYGTYDTSYGPPSGCNIANPYTGGCSCPAGYSATGGETGLDVHTHFYRYFCYK